MSFVEILVIALGMAMDAFAVSLSAGTSGMATGPRATFRLSFHFGLFQFFMPLIGWSMGIGISSYIESIDHWVAFGLLAFVGVRMIRGGVANREKTARNDPSRGLTLVALAIATSIDALAIGLSLAMLQVNIWYPAAVIGVVTAGLSFLGIRLGNRLGDHFGQRMEIIGGVLLILIGVRILVSHLFG